MNDEDIVLGGARKSISKMKSEQQYEELLGIRSFYFAVAQYLINRLPFGNKLQTFLSCLNPVRRFDYSSVSDVGILARQLNNDGAMNVHLVDEWKIYQTDVSAEEYERIYHYWRSNLMAR